MLVAMNAVKLVPLGVALAIGFGGVEMTYARQDDAEWRHGWKRGHDRVPPSFDSSMPEHRESAVDIHSRIFIFYDESVDVSWASIELRRSDTGSHIESNIDVRGATVILTPKEKLEYSTSYYVESHGPVFDERGNIARTPVYIRFTTEDIELPSPSVTYSPADGEYVAPSGEMYVPVAPERAALHAVSHSYFPVVTATLPAIFDAPIMSTIQDYVIERDEMVVANPAQDEFLWIMEGKRHGFDNLTVVLTHTLPGNGAPLHTHVGEEAHILLEGKMRYFLGDEEAVVEAPYILNIPSMVPHAFMNVGDEPAKLVGVFPDSNSWDYDILDAQVFEAETPEEAVDTSTSITASGLKPEEWLKRWHSPENRKKRLDTYKKVRNR